MLNNIILFLKDIKLQIEKYLSKDSGEEHPWYDLYENAPKHLDYPYKTMYELILEQAKKHSNEKAYNYFGKKCNYKTFNEQIINAAKGLRMIGVKKDDKVTICMANTPDAIIMFYAVNMVGAIANMVHPLASEEETRLYLTKSGSKYVHCLDLVYKKFSNLDKDLNLKKIIISKISSKMPPHLNILYKITKSPPSIPYSDKVISFKNLNNLGEEYPLSPKVNVRAKDDAVIIYSGGTTGDPKGVVLTNMNINAMALQCYKMAYPINQGDSALATLPIFHSFGLGVLIHTLFIHGISIVLVPGFNAKDFGKLIQKYKPQMIVGVPTMFEALINSKIKSKKSMKSLHTIICGGDLLNSTLRDKVDIYLKAHGCEAKIRMGYGLSETSGACSLTPRNYFKEGGIGIPFPDTLIKICKIGTREELEIEEVGEICVSGPSVMSRYLNDIKETNKVLKRHKDGRIWLHTGDIGYLNNQGMLFFKSRLKRMIVSNGYNIYPQYLEKIIMEHPAIETCTIIGLPHSYRQAVPKAYIVLKENFEDTDIIRKEIEKFCEKRINNYELPHEYEYVKSLPTTLLGKVAFTKLGETNNEKN